MRCLDLHVLGRQNARASNRVLIGQAQKEPHPNVAQAFFESQSFPMV